MTHVIQARNVNDAFAKAITMMRQDLTDVHRPEGGTMRGANLRRRQPLGKAVTVEHVGPVITEYEAPLERVLFSGVRDVNPYFHLMETLWILAGRADVAWLARFNKQMAAYSDDGNVFHAPYGFRLRKMSGLDQIHEAAEVLRKDPFNRQAVLQIWNYAWDLNVPSKDIPCNDLLFAKVNDGFLDLTVCCRSNDIIWGCYGTNMVQFSMIQERLAAQVGVPVGILRQFSDSFHYYPDNEATKRIFDSPFTFAETDPYRDFTVAPVPLFNGVHGEVETWEDDLAHFMMMTEPMAEDHLEGIFPVQDGNYRDRFFTDVAVPMYTGWAFYKKQGPQYAANYMLEQMQRVRGYTGYDVDWLYAGREWMLRRAAKKENSNAGG